MSKEQILEIKTFGTFSVTVNGRSVTDTSARSGKIWTLFKYIITHRSTPIPTDKLIEVLWPDDEIEKPINALFTLVYRLRGILNSYFDEKQNFIIFHHDCYIWNKDSPYTLDAEQFENGCTTLDSSVGYTDELLQKGHQTFNLYQGDYLPELPEDWVVPVNYYYKRLYSSLVLKMSQLYAQKGDFNSIIKLCERAIDLDPYEESHHIALIDALIHLGQPSQALAHYDFITYILQKDLGVKPSNALLELRKKMYQQPDTHQNIQQIKSTLSEQEDLLPGAFFCDIDAFRHIYRLEERMGHRADHLAFLVEITVNLDQKDDETLTEAMTMLRRTALFTLRRNDIITQYSHRQLLLLLQSSSLETCEEVIKRIATQFVAETKSKFTSHLEHSIVQI